jgi:DNA-binding MarR family transcriptional regulator
LQLMKESPKPQCIERIEHAISSMHFANKTVASAYGTGLGLLESSILVELRALPELSAQELTVRIGVSPVATSRALMKLERDGLIRRRQDGRRINNIITTHGDAVFNQAFERAKITFSNAYGRLPDRSRDPFLQSLTKMVTNLKAPPAAALKEDPPLMSTIRRLTRALGFITPSAYHFSAVTPLEWHILRTLALRQPGSAPIMARSLAADIGVSSNTMFSVVRRMARRGLLTQQRNSSDKRERPLAISSAGKDLFNQGRNVARKLIAVPAYNPSWRV